MKRICVGTIQFDIQKGRTAENLEYVKTSLRLLSEQGADLVVLPEMWTCGFDNRNLKDHAEKTVPVLETLSRIAVKHSLTIAGSMPEDTGNGIANTLYVVDAYGNIGGRYRKLHLFTPTQEDRYFVSGDKPVVCETPAGKLGLMICYDLRFPELARALALEGAEILLVPAQWPLVRVWHWETLLAARAIENQLFIVGANRSGKEPGIEYAGHSAVFSPGGKKLLETGTGDAVQVCKLDPEEMDNIRNFLPCLRHRKPHLYAG